jgi:hypothetical protein
MEPDIKTLLTQKIRSVEREPITWNKQAVWVSVSNQIKTKRSYRIYYYAAAAIILVLVAVRPLRHSKTIDKVNETTGIDEKHLPVQRESLLPGEMQEAENVNEIKHARKANQLVVQVQSGAVSADKTPELMLQPVEEVIAVQTELILDESIVITEVVAEETIQPIIGVVEWSDQNIAAEKVRKKKLLRKLETSDKEWDDSSGNNAILFARIK